MTRWPAPSRAAVSRAALAALAAIIAVSIAIGWATRTGHPAAAIDSLESPSPRSSAGCENVRVDQCREVLTDDGHLVRYAVLPPSENATGKGAAIFDAGGPGISVFGAHWPSSFDQDVRPALPTVPVVVIEEPWVTSPMPQRCEKSLQDWFKQAHALAPVTGSLSDCSIGLGLWGWTPQDYRNAVAAVESDTGLRIDGMIGASFGAYRTQYIGERLDWAVLANPAPATMDGQTYMHARHDAVLALLSEECGCDQREVTQRLDDLVARVGSLPTSRSVPVTAADVGAAALALAYLPADGTDADAFWAGDPDTIGLLADSVWGRYGIVQIAPSYLAYLDEVCAAYAPWPDPIAGAGDVITRTLTAIHSPCAQVPPRKVDPLPAASRVCVSGLSQDPIAPPAFKATWHALESYTSEGDEHSNLSAASTCIEKTRPDTD